MSTLLVLSLTAMSCFALLGDGDVGDCIVTRGWLPNTELPGGLACHATQKALVFFSLFFTRKILRFRRWHVCFCMHWHES